MQAKRAVPTEAEGLEGPYREGSGPEVTGAVGAGGPGAEGIVPSHARTAPGKPQASAGGTPVGAPARPHRLAVAAARRGLEGLDPNAIPGNLPIADVWARMAAATSLTDEALARELARILPVREADLAEACSVPLSRELAALERRLGVRILSDDGRTLVVATPDPLDLEAEQLLAFRAGRHVAFRIAPPARIRMGTEAPSDAVELDRILDSFPWSEETGVTVEAEEEPEEIEIGEISAEPIVRLADSIVQEAIRQGASDIHLEPADGRGLVRLRVDGVLRPHLHLPLAALHRLISRFKIIGDLDIADRVRPQDGQVRIRVGGERFELRISTVPTQDAEKAVLRVAGHRDEGSIDRIGLPEPELSRLRGLLTHRDGLLVVTGPTGSGKTTTLYAALAALNSGDVNIVTVEDPVERRINGTTQIQIQPRRGVTFPSALRAVLRQDPDVILVGEIRDRETAEIAFRAAMTGHLVLTTLHTTTAVGAVTRLRDLGLDPALLAATLRGVVSQRLVRKVCAPCEGSGCAVCGASGFRGRLPVLEVLTVDDAFTEKVGRDAPPVELHRAALAGGMRTMREVALERVRLGETTESEVLRVLGETGEGIEADLGRTDPAVVDAGSEAGLTERAVASGAGPSAHMGGSEPRLDESSVERVLRAPEIPPVPPAHFEELPFEERVARARDLRELLALACGLASEVLGAPLVWSATSEGDAFAVHAPAELDADEIEKTLPRLVTRDGAPGALGEALLSGMVIGGPIEDPALLGGGTASAPLRLRAAAHGLETFLALPIGVDGKRSLLLGVHGAEPADDASPAVRTLRTRLAPVVEALTRLRVLETLNLPLAALDARTDAVLVLDASGRIQWVNRAFTALTGHDARNALGRTTHFLRSDRHPVSFHQKMRETLLSGRAWHGEVWNRRSDGSVHPIEQTITPLGTDGAASGFVTVQRDIEERRRREEDVARLALTDPETDLWNGRGVLAELERRIEWARSTEPGTFLLLRIASAGGSNGTSARHALDERLLRNACERVKRVLPEGAFFGRIGGDELAVLVRSDTAEAVVDRIRRTLSVPELEGGAFETHVGIAAFDGSQSPRAVIAQADAVIHAARDAGTAPGEGRAHSASGSPALEGNAWTDRIDRALEEGHFFLHFQPVVRLSSGEVDHFSALLRLYGEDGSTVPARAFIGHAEESGQIEALDRWVIGQAVRLLRASPELTLSVNLSPTTLLSDAFGELASEEGDRLALVGPRLLFEVPATAELAASERANRHMARLSELGCRFALDHVGIDPAGIACLGALPTHFVKLDGTLVAGISRDLGAREIVGSIVTIAHALGREVIGSRAETRGVVDWLPNLGVDLGEGHQFGHPEAPTPSVPETGDDSGEPTPAVRAAG